MLILLGAFFITSVSSTIGTRTRPTRTRSSTALAAPGSAPVRYMPIAQAYARGNEATSRPAVSSSLIRLVPIGFVF